MSRGGDHLLLNGYIQTKGKTLVWQKKTLNLAEGKAKKALDLELQKQREVLLHLSYPILLSTTYDLFSKRQFTLQLTNLADRSLKPR